MATIVFCRTDSWWLSLDVNYWIANLADRYTMVAIDIRWLFGRLRCSIEQCILLS